MKHKKYLQEIVNRIDYFYRQTDGSLKYPDGQIAQLCGMIIELNSSLKPPIVNNKDKEVLK